MNRRDFLKLVGVSTIAPTILADLPPLVVERPREEIKVPEPNETSNYHVEVSLLDKDRKVITEKIVPCTVREEDGSVNYDAGNVTFPALDKETVYRIRVRTIQKWGRGGSGSIQLAEPVTPAGGDLTISPVRLKVTWS